MKYKVSFCIVAVIWLLLTVAAWFSPAEDVSVSERRPLAQKPELKVEHLLNGTYMKEFERFSLDQFPLRDGFRSIKALLHYSVWNHSDNNGIYLSGGMAAQQEYPLNEDSLLHAADRFTHVYEKYLQDSKVYMAVVPDKGQYLAEQSGNLALDLAKMQTILAQQIPWAQHIDLSDTLDRDSYYSTDTHWRQEALWDAAARLCEALGTAAPRQEEYTQVALERPFYGVYYGQAALPLEPETMYILRSQGLDRCGVYDYETGRTGQVYDLSGLESRDLYDVFLSGAKSLLTIENPDGPADRELIIFRDSFGSAIAPLLINGYGRVTLVDIRYLPSGMLPKYLDFHGQDVLFLYSSLVLNNSSSIK